MPEKEKPENHEVRLGSPFCSDPNCPYCKELRDVQDELRRKKEKEPNGKSCVRNPIQVPTRPFLRTRTGSILALRLPG